jgi:hypothetical protein
MAIVNAYSGSFPWRKQQKKFDAKSGYQYNVGITREKGGKRRGSTGYYATGGFSVISPDQYTDNPTKPEMVEIRLYNGRKSYVPIGDVEQFIGFNKIETAYVPEEMAAEYEKAFRAQSGRGRYYGIGSFLGEDKGTGSPCGHIAGIRYNPSMQIMEVAFGGNASSRPDTVTFFRIPKDIYGELENHYNSGAMSLGVDGTQRHLCGIRFWDLVRIRGQRTGARYPFTYTTGGMNTGAQASSFEEHAAQLMRINAGEQQATDAQREATITHTEEPSEAERKQIENEDSIAALKKALANDTFLPIQKERIKEMRDVLIDRYGTRNPAYREFNAAVESGNWTAVYQVGQRYHLRGERNGTEK